MNKDFSEFKNFIKGKNTAVVGIGVSNIPLIKFLIKLGAKVTAFDKKNKEELGNTSIELESEGAKLVLGEDYLSYLDGFEVVFKTPSMRIDSPALLKCKEQGAYITSEMEEFIRYCPGKIFAITGSDGKTTTTTLVYEILKTEGYNTWVGGNIGTPLFTKIEEIKNTDKVVLELSSFQLMTIQLPIEVSAVTNLSPNHLDMHKSMNEYIEAKENIFKFQRENDLLVLNIENDITYNMKDKANSRINFFSSKTEVPQGAYFKENKLYLRDKEVCKKEELVLMGMHNVENLLTAFLVTNEDASIESMKKVATTFSGVQHRSEFIREIDGVKYYNDSIATSPTRAVASLKAFDRKVILIAGGYDKHIPFEYLAEEGHEKIKKLILLGVTKEKIKDVFDKVIKEKTLDLPIYIVQTLEEAAYKAKEIAEEGDIVTLSPACASFDMFANFEIRGNKFKDIVKAM
ncbi:UDP-N-acetylmuramoyl-L-alanine--D-glutamate ligase [Clostridium cellulovorans]|uniref:UDP-N-acetylmuramoylalanine--D-glutamate ligase n=1 Tax=Clostridium cellulovorans (strain ATCC 35296 / DSM 3052 / OCM 3 / 743B) TaxID=573061 RepID=D9SXE4_CLOC7|nr:UDP-N-acetylmuramoyl-L-alanine--D-glutamate ligase [Clostridium cellulovorans]ADL53447.1 UDP-N-acetylmuramoylalanine/D-glutamate ligase [Clostridium cellulovorans 743B]